MQSATLSRLLMLSCKFFGVDSEFRNNLKTADSTEPEQVDENSRFAKKWKYGHIAAQFLSIGSRCLAWPARHQQRFRIFGILGLSKGFGISMSNHHCSSIIADMVRLCR